MAASLKDDGQQAQVNAMKMTGTAGRALHWNDREIHLLVQELKNALADAHVPHKPEVAYDEGALLKRVGSCLERAQ